MENVIFIESSYKGKRLFEVTSKVSLASIILPRIATIKTWLSGETWLLNVWNERRQWAHSASKIKGYPGSFKPGNEICKAKYCNKR
jgi:hypothetical protein